jgi:hypothetical protein
MAKNTSILKKIPNTSRLLKIKANLKKIHTILYTRNKELSVVYKEIQIFLGLQNR